MSNMDNTDLKIILLFSNRYEKLYEKGEITATQLDHVLSLIDQYKNYEPKEFEKNLKEIF
jgi:inorganic pyrophosphatase